MADSMRSLNSFGVAGLLGPDCEVFYTNDLRARNVGRISDLITAQLRETNSDEHRIRAILMHGVYQSYAVRGLSMHHSEEAPPVSVEVGIDPSYIAITLSFHWEHNRIPNWKGIPDRIIGGMPEGGFETILEAMTHQSTQIIVRFEEKERRIEVVALLNRSDSEMKDPLQVIKVLSASAPLLEVSKYHELGDLDYTKLLKNPANEEVVSIPETENPDSVATLKRDEPLDSETNELRALLGQYEQTISGLKTTVSQLEEKLEIELNRASERRFTSDSQVEDNSPIVVKEPESEGDAAKSEDDWGLHFMKKVWPFKKSEEKTEADESVTVSGGEDETQVDEEKRVFAADPIKSEDTIVVKDSELETQDSEDDDKPTVTEASVASAKVLEEIADLAKSKRSKKLDSTFKEIEDEVDKNKAKKWVETLSSELLQEKAKLNELQRNLSKQIRQRELEFKTAERALKQELKRREEQLRSKDTAIENKVEQIAQLNLAVERAGTATADKESGQIKMKLDRAQRMAQMKEEEAKSLLVKVRDLENRLIIAQAKAQKGTDLQMQTKVQTLEKKVDEYKRVNQRLMENLNQTKDKSNDKELGDLRRKIDQLERQSGEAKKTMDKNAFKLKELQDTEKKLQADLARAVEENRNLRKNQGKPPGESGGQNAA